MSTSHIRPRSESGERHPPTSRSKRDSLIFAEVPLSISAPIGNEDTNYVCVILPKEVLDTFKEFLITIHKDKNPTPPNVDPLVEDPASVEDLDKLTDNFIKDFDALKKMATEHNESFADAALIRDLPTADFEKYKRYRKDLNSWITTCQHLANKLKYPSVDAYNKKYVKIDYDFSPAIPKDEFREQLISTLDRTVDSLETKCTAKVLKRAISLNERVEDLMEREEVFKTLPFAKAIRTVWKSNRRLINDTSRRTFHRTSRKNLDDYYQRQPRAPKPAHIQTSRQYPMRRTRFSNSDRHTYYNRSRDNSYRVNFDDYDDFPDIEEVDYDYRRHKRYQPEYRPSRLDRRGDEEIDEDVFYNNNFRRHRK